jgi:two-component system, LytTR family, sensor kinase
MPFTNSSKILIHIAAWLLFFCLVLAFAVNDNHIGITTILFSPRFWIFTALYLGIFYLNVGLLIPKLLLQKKYILYGLFIVILGVIVLFVKPFDGILSLGRIAGSMPPPGGGAPPIGPGGGPQFDIVGLILFITVVLAGCIAQLVQQWQLTEKRAVQAERDKANAELSLLKSQINPHFLFNTLNNIYSLAVAGKEQVPAAIMKLSNIMRFFTDDATQQFVPLETEANCIADYIDLQKMRLTNKVTIKFTVNGSIDAAKIAPLLLMTYVENAFKHGVSAHDKSEIDIRIMLQGNTITFHCKNSLFDVDRKAERTGIGLTNNKKRLEQLYPGRHQLIITSENGMYTVDLVIKTSISYAN